MLFNLYLFYLYLLSLSLLQGIFPTQGLNPGLPHYRRILYQMIHKGSPRILEWVGYCFSSRSSQPRNRTRVSCIAGDSLLTEPSGKPSFSAEAFAMAVPVSHVFGALKRTEFSRVLLSAWDPDTGVIWIIWESLFPVPKSGFHVWSGQTFHLSMATWHP